MLEYLAQTVGDFANNNVTKEAIMNPENIVVKPGQRWVWYPQNEFDKPFTIVKIGVGVAICERGVRRISLEKDGTLRYKNSWTYLGLDSFYMPCFDCGQICRQSCQKLDS